MSNEVSPGRSVVSHCHYFAVVGILLSHLALHRSFPGVFGLPTFLLLVDVQLMACLGSLLSVVRSTCPYHLHRRILITSTTDCSPVMFLSSTSLTWSYHLIFIKVLRHPLSNLLTLFSISSKPFQN